MTTNIKIVTADYNSPDHARGIIAMMAGYSADIMGGSSRIEESLLQKLPSALSKRQDAYTALALSGHKTVGLINCFEGFSTFRCQPLLNIHDVYVDPHFRGKGIARSLLNHVEDFAKKRNYCKLTLEVLEGNRQARSTYEKHGFRSYQLSEETGYALFLEKTLYE